MGDKTWGQIAYEGYLERAGGKSLVSGAHLPEFADLDHEIQDAWEAAGTAVYDAVTAIPGGN